MELYVMGCCVMSGELGEFGQNILVFGEKSLNMELLEYAIK